jgi:hypothetical protein
VVSRAALGIVLPAALLGTAGCFDVHDADPGILLIDNFDDGDYLPYDPSFGNWQCNTFNPNNQVYSCGRDVGYNSPYSLQLKFTLTDPLDGALEHGGASLLTQAFAPQDLSRFSEFVFSVEVESGVPSVPSDATLYVALYCAGLQPDAGADSSAAPGVFQSVPFDNSWRTRTLSLANFAAPIWPAPALPGGPAACLKQVNAIWFQMSPDLPDGQSAMGQLNVDNIYLR